MADHSAISPSLDGLADTWQGYISSTFFGEFKFAFRDQSDQESEGAVLVSLRDKD